VYGDIFVFHSDESCGMMNMFHKILSNDGLALFIISLMGLFVYSKSSIKSRVVLPTTDIIEPF
ncbi:MAG: hypothetical protein Q4A90_07515, partial [Streptococcus sp.]|nr:hypothetical protein [Streptococcus sp.]